MRQFEEREEAIAKDLDPGSLERFTYASNLSGK